MYRFKVKRNPKMLEDVKLSVLQNGYLGFFFVYFDPQTKNFHFSKINIQNILNFGATTKNGIYVVNVLTNKTHTKFEGNIFIFGYVMVKKKQVEVMMSLFEMQFLTFLIVVRKNE